MNSRRKLCRILAVGAVCLLLASASQATLIAYDSFDYTMGTAVADSGTLGAVTNGFANAWKLSTGITGEVVNNLSFSGQTTSGNALKLTFTGSTSAYLFRGMTASLSAGTYYMSFIGYRDDVNTGGYENWNWTLKNSSSYSSGPTSSTKLTAGSTSTEEDNLLVAGDSMQTGSAYSIDSTFMMLLKFTIDDAGSETASLVFYGAGDTLPASEAGIVWDVSSTGEFSGGAGWRLSIPTSITTMTVDEFKLGTELSDVFTVVPEPATVGLFGLGSLATMVGRRMKKR